MTYMVEIAMPMLEVSANNKEEILVAAREYVAEHGIEVFADRMHEDEDQSPDDEEYLSILWRPGALGHGPN